MSTAHFAQGAVSPMKTGWGDVYVYNTKVADRMEFVEAKKQKVVFVTVLFGSHFLQAQVVWIPVTAMRLGVVFAPATLLCSNHACVPANPLSRFEFWSHPVFC